MRIHSIFFIFICIVSTTARAAVDASLTVNAGLEYHTNIDRTAENELSDTDRQLGAEVYLSHQSNLTQTSLAYDINKHNFLHDRQDDRTSAEGSARIDVNIVKNRLSWFASNSLSEDLRNSRQADVLNNRERRSVTATGISAVGRLSKRDYLVISPAASKVTFQDSEQSDSDRRNLNLSWNHKLSFVSELNLNVFGSKVEFDNINSNYDYTAVNIGLTTRLSRTNYSVALGTNKVNPEIGDSIDGLTIRANADVSTSPTAWGFSLISQLTDSSIGFTGFETQIENFQSSDSNFTTVDIVRRTQFQTYVRSTLSPRASLGFRATINEERYEIQPDDQFRIGLNASYAYQYSQRLSITPILSWQETEFRDDPQDEKQQELQASLDLAYDFQNSITTRFSVGTRKRDSSEYADSEYTDRFAVVSLAYRVR